MILKRKTMILKRKRTRFRSEDWQQYSMCVIPVLLVFLFNYVPMFGVVIAFKNYQFDKGIFGSAWVGFKNFEFLLDSNQFARITYNTLSLNFIMIIVGILAALTVAILLYQLRSVRAIKVYQTILITPHFLSWVIVGYMAYAFLNPSYGLMNHILESLGFHAIDYYSRPDIWPAILTLASVWKHVGLDCVIYYAALVGIDTTLFEAAEVDGANRWRVVRSIILPGLLPLVVILTILKIGGIFRADFGLFYQLTRDVGALYATTDVIDTYIFRTMRVIGDMGMSSAAGLLQSVVGFVMVVVANKLSKKIDADGGLF